MLPTDIDVKRKSPMEGSGPFDFDTAKTVGGRMLNDIVNAPPGTVPPNLIHIGYNASAWSLTYCNIAGSNLYSEATWKHDVQAYAAAEASAINGGADIARFFHFRVLLTKGPGTPASNAAVKAPLLARSAQQKLTDACMADAFFWVSYFLGGMNTELWVDYSGKTVDPRLGGSPVAAWTLGTSDVWHWEQDGIHVSSDKLKYDGNDPPVLPIVGYQWSFTVGSGPNQVPQTSLGAYREAKNVLRAYQAIRALP